MICDPGFFGHHSKPVKVPKDLVLSWIIGFPIIVLGGCLMYLVLTNTVVLHIFMIIGVISILSVAGVAVGSGILDKWRRWRNRK